MSIKSLITFEFWRDKWAGRYPNADRIFNRFKKYLTNMGWLFAGKMARMILSMIVGIWVARYLGVEQFGILSFCMTVALLFRPMALFQLEGICIREIVATPEKKDDILGSSFVLSLLAGIISFLAAMGMIHILRPEEQTYAVIVAIAGSGLVFFCFETFDYWFQAQVKSKVVVVSRSLVLTVSSLVKIAGIWFELPLVYFAWVNMAEIVLTGLSLAIAYKKSGNSIKGLGVKWQWVKKLVSDAWPLALSGIAATVYLRIDKIMIGQMSDAAHVGIYTAATRLAEAWYFLPISIMATLYPAVIKAIKDPQVNSDDRMQQIYKLMILIGYLAAILTMVAAKPLVLLLFGDEYETSAQVLALYVWSGIFVNIAMAKAAWLKAMNFTKIQFISTIVGATVNIGLNLFLIKDYGVIGAAWATIISYAIEAYLILFLFPGTRKQAQMITRAMGNPIIKMNKIL